MINRKKLNATMGRLGFQERYVGTEYLRMACDIIDRDRRAMMCKEIYPAIARARAGATFASVERSIRESINRAKESPYWEEEWRSLGGTSCTYNSEVMHRLTTECQDEN